MKAKLTIKDETYQIDLDAPLSIGITLNPFGQNPTCFHAPQPTAGPMVFQDFICQVDQGAPVNFYSLSFVPHGNGTHTECVGHITQAFEKVNQTIKNPFFLAHLVTVHPEIIGPDHVITLKSLQSIPNLPGQALVIRTLPNASGKKIKNYTGCNPPYLSTEATEYILSKGYDHLILDIPSIDKEQDEGKVMNHKLFWNYSEERSLSRTITELAFIPNSIPDGVYILNLKVSNIALDAVPSEPILYAIEHKHKTNPSV